MSSSPKTSSPDERSSPANPSRSIAATSASPSSDRTAFAIPCHLPSAKKPVSEITSASTASAWSQAQASPRNPPQSWTQTATALEPQPGDEPGERLEVRLERLRALGSESPSP